MRDVEVIDEPGVAVVALDPTRARILAVLAEPGSSTSVAATLGLPRQRVNHHVRALEQAGLVEYVADRQRRGLTERVVQATAAGYVVAPPNLGRDAADPTRLDRVSSRYLVALAARVVREVAALAHRAELAGRPLATLAIDSDLRLATAADRAAFTHELTEAVTALVARYHDEGAPSGRWHRLVIASYPRPRQEKTRD
ncbi:MAG: winged helix-turn-helix domain-containing protein [Dermatophilaceae bacterium]